MSTSIKSILVIIVIAGAGAALWWSGWLNNIGLMLPTQQEAAAVTPQQTQQEPTAVNDLPTAATDASESALQQDVAALDVQIQATAGDVSQVDQGLNDKSVTQEY